jgi:hypothetical protein
MSKTTDKVIDEQNAAIEREQGGAGTSHDEREQGQAETDALVKEINTAIRDGINQWADVMLESEVKQWAYRLDYFPRDLMNAIYIFQHVASNIGIKAGRISEQNTEEFGHRLRQLVIDMTGYDPHGILNDLAIEGKEAAK